jgi:phosphoenolpyruvate carboxykinase (GTP)
MNRTLESWVDDMVALCKPDGVQWVDGSEDENRRLIDAMLADGTLHRLNESKVPNSYLHRSNPNDVARTEHLTFICSEREGGGRPHEQLDVASRRHAKLGPLFDGAMRGRTMYVIPYVMGPLGSPSSKVGIEITDSPYVVAEHAHHDAHGRRGARQLGRLDRLRAGFALDWATSTPIAASSATSRRTTRSGASARATAATCSSARSASRCASQLPRPKRAGSPSTC